jgi:beta-galactosidase GanA
VVDGQPFLIIGGELHNSSSSDLASMQPIWQRLVALGLNTALAAVSWELVEPEEGRFDWGLVDGMIAGARQSGLRLILLWFGSWKNGESTYAPLWVKRDYRRFPRARRRGQATEVLSTLSDANRDADARAFAALMGHLREVDGDDHTVIMVQVENEVGLLGDSRDRSEAADAAFAAPVPSELLKEIVAHDAELWPALRERWRAQGALTAGSWEQVFGTSVETDELFMAWHYARYVDAVAAAGKAAYNLPMFANAWLNAVVAIPGLPAGGNAPGNWPSGGPLPHTLDAWLAGAPHLDLLSPDIYFGNFFDWCRQYTRRGNPLLIPEMRRDEEGARNVFYAIAQHDAIGVSPFGIDSLYSPIDAPLVRSYRLLQQLAPLILEHQGRGAMVGFVVDEEHPSVTHQLGGYELEITTGPTFGGAPTPGYGIVISTGQDTFVGAGFGFRVAFRPTTPGPAIVGLAAVDEGRYEGGRWVAGRRLNGDERNGWTFPPAERPATPFPIPLLGAESAISRCVVYRYE